VPIPCFVQYTGTVSVPIPCFVQYTGTVSVPIPCFVQYTGTVSVPIPQLLVLSWHSSYFESGTQINTGTGTLDTGTTDTVLSVPMFRYRCLSSETARLF
jgi:hypothetical protein